MAMRYGSRGRSRTGSGVVLGTPSGSAPKRACTDARWRLALGDVPAFHPTTPTNCCDKYNSNCKKSNFVAGLENANMSM